MMRVRRQQLQRKASAQRAGVSLIEVMVVISILTVMLTLSGMTFHLLLRTDKTVAQSFVIERAISRLGVQFRNDIHQARSAVLTHDEESGSFELKLTDGRGSDIHYVATEGSLIRFVLEGEAIAAREDFRLPGCRVSFASGQGADDALRTLIIERPGATIVQKEQMPRPLRSLRIEAYLHRQAIPKEMAASTEAKTVTNTAETPE